MMTLEDNIEYYMQHGIRNINCGIIRQNGKTEILKKIIRKFKELNPTKRIVVIVSNRQMDYQYRDLFVEKIVEFITSTDNYRRALPPRRDNLLIFSDEVPRMEELLDRHGILQNFVCGLYSHPPETCYLHIGEQKNINFPSFKNLEVDLSKKLNKFEYINET